MASALDDCRKSRLKQRAVMRIKLAKVEVWYHFFSYIFTIFFNNKMLPSKIKKSEGIVSLSWECQAPDMIVY